VFLVFLLAFLIAPTSASADTFWQKLSWTTPTNVVLVGLYHPASQSKAYTWVLLHGLGSNKEEWNTFARLLAQQGAGVFIYDARGHNESNHMANGQPINYKDWLRAGPGTPWEGMPGDMTSAVQELRKRYHVSEKKLAVGGASLGANVALIYASEHPRVPAVVLLSSGIEYAGISIVSSWVHFASRPVFAAASPQDLNAYATLRFLSQQRTDIPLLMVQGQGAQHGVNMFQNPEFTKTLLAWMKKVE
jgi:alpha-beta hydrolase superfamily lysophospholipase